MIFSSCINNGVSKLIMNEEIIMSESITLTDQESYGAYIASECFATATTIDPTFLKDGIGQLNLSLLAELQNYEKILIVGISGDCND